MSTSEILLRKTEMFDKGQSQSAAQGSNAVQAAGDVTITQVVGLSYAEVRDVALDVFESNFFKLAGVAQEIARSRAEEITEIFLNRLQEQNPQGISKSEEPDFQHALFTAQKAYARTGDKDLGDLLVDLLVDRSKQSSRDLLQIVLNESLETAPKLTNSQLAVLAIIFLFRYTQNAGIGTHALLGEHLDRNVKPFADQITTKAASYQHLEFAGCGSIQMGEILLERVMTETYRGHFMNGFDSSERASNGLEDDIYSPFFAICLNDPTKIQVRAVNKETLAQTLSATSIPAEQQAKITNLFDRDLMSDSEVRAKCIAIRPYMETVFDCWTNSQMKAFTLTSVGMAIGHANIKRLAGEFTQLSIWID